MSRTGTFRGLPFRHQGGARDGQTQIFILPSGPSISVPVHALDWDHQAAAITDGMPALKKGDKWMYRPGGGSPDKAVEIVDLFEDRVRFRLENGTLWTDTQEMFRQTSSPMRVAATTAPDPMNAFTPVAGEWWTINSMDFPKTVEVLEVAGGWVRYRTSEGANLRMNLSDFIGQSDPAVSLNRPLPELKPAIPFFSRGDLVRDPSNRIGTVMVDDGTGYVAVEYPNLGVASEDRRLLTKLAVDQVTHGPSVVTGERPFRRGDVVREKTTARRYMVTLASGSFIRGMDDQGNPISGSVNLFELEIPRAEIRMEELPRDVKEKLVAMAEKDRAVQVKLPEPVTWRLGGAVKNKTDGVLGFIYHIEKRPTQDDRTLTVHYPSGLIYTRQKPDEIEPYYEIQAAAVDIDSVVSINGRVGQVKRVVDDMLTCWDPDGQAEFNASIFEATIVAKTPDTLRDNKVPPIGIPEWAQDVYRHLLELGAEDCRLFIQVLRLDGDDRRVIVAARTFLDSFPFQVSNAVNPSRVQGQVPVRPLYKRQEAPVDDPRQPGG